MRKMMKCFALILMVCTCLMACGKKAPAAADVDLDLAAVCDQVVQSQSNPDGVVLFEESDPELIESLYPGISDVKTSKFALYAPPVTGFACEICMVKVENEADIDTVKQIFQARIDSGASGGQCDEDVAEIWKNNAKVQEYGKYVAMIALPSDCTIPENIFTMK